MASSDESMIADRCAAIVAGSLKGVAGNADGVRRRAPEVATAIRIAGHSFIRHHLGRYGSFVPRSIVMRINVMGVT
jgi:hypothetical protein